MNYPSCQILVPYDPKLFEHVPTDYRGGTPAAVAAAASPAAVAASLSSSAPVAGSAGDFDVPDMSAVAPGQSLNQSECYILCLLLVV